MYQYGFLYEKPHLSLPGLGGIGFVIFWIEEELIYQAYRVPLNTPCSWPSGQPVFVPSAVGERPHKYHLRRCIISVSSQISFLTSVPKNPCVVSWEEGEGGSNLLPGRGSIATSEARTRVFDVLAPPEDSL